MNYLVLSSLFQTWLRLFGFAITGVLLLLCASTVARAEMYYMVELGSDTVQQVNGDPEAAQNVDHWAIRQPDGKPGGLYYSSAQEAVRALANYQKEEKECNQFFGNHDHFWADSKAPVAVMKPKHATSNEMGEKLFDAFGRVVDGMQKYEALKDHVDAILGREVQASDETTPIQEYLENMKRMVSLTSKLEQALFKFNGGNLQQISSMIDQCTAEMQKCPDVEAAGRVVLPIMARNTLQGNNLGTEMIFGSIVNERTGTTDTITLSIFWPLSDLFQRREDQKNNLSASVSYNNRNYPANCVIQDDGSLSMTWNDKDTQQQSSMNLTFRQGNLIGSISTPGTFISTPGTGTSSVNFNLRRALHPYGI